FEGRPGYALSMGERQRVALARAIAARPRVILLDEPFAASDPEVRGELRGDFRRALEARGISAIHVTHDREEGLFLGDRVAVLLEGRIRSLGTPAELLADPRSSAVARFLGFNVLPSNGGVVAIDPADTQFVDSSSDLLPAQMLAAGTVGRDSVGIARGISGERIEARGPLGHRWPAAGSTIGVRWTNARTVAPE
ncbi:MAG: ATP-binding cassette domain-containing protein, partial [Thermoplasmata archaeon]